jgi:DNA-binding NarL/FixJ family response regulator
LLLRFGVAPTPPLAARSVALMKREATLRLLIAEDHQAVRQGLIAILQREGFEVIGEAADGREAVEMCRDHPPDVALLDISMPLLNGIDAARIIIEENPEIRVILVTQHTDEQFVLDGLRAGATGYVLKQKAAAELATAIREVYRGGVYLSSGISTAVVRACLDHRDLPADPLTPREREVLQLVAEGKTTKEIGTILGVSAKTAEKHRENMMEKLDIHDVAGLVRYAMLRGLT